MPCSVEFLQLFQERGFPHPVRRSFPAWKANIQDVEIRPTSAALSQLPWQATRTEDSELPRDSYLPWKPGSLLNQFPVQPVRVDLLAQTDLKALEKLAASPDDPGLAARARQRVNFLRHQATGIVQGESCLELPALPADRALAAAEVLQTMRRGHVEGGWEFLRTALRQGWEPTPAQARELGGHTLAAVQNVRDYGSGHEEAGLGLDCLIEVQSRVPRSMPADFFPEAAELVFRGQGEYPLHLDREQVQWLVQSDTPEKLLGQMLSQPDGPGTGAAVVALASFFGLQTSPQLSERFQTALRPLLGISVEDPEVAEVLDRERQSQLNRNANRMTELPHAQRLELIADSLALSRGLPGKRTGELGKFEELLVPAILQSQANRYDLGRPEPSYALAASKALVQQSLPEELWKQGAEALQSLLQESPDRFLAWDRFVEGLQAQPDDPRQALQNLQLGLKQAARGNAVGVGTDAVKIGGTRLKVRTRS